MVQILPKRLVVGCPSRCPSSSINFNSPLLFGAWLSNSEILPRSLAFIKACSWNPGSLHAYRRLFALSVLCVPWTFDVTMSSSVQPSASWFLPADAVCIVLSVHVHPRWLYTPCCEPLSTHGNLVERIICTFLFGPAVLLFSFQPRLPIEEASGSNTSFRTLAWIEIFSLQRVMTWLLASAVLQSLRPGSTWQLVELVLVWCFSRLSPAPMLFLERRLLAAPSFPWEFIVKISNFYNLIVFFYLSFTGPILHILVGSKHIRGSHRINIPSELKLRDTESPNDWLLLCWINILNFL